MSGIWYTTDKKGDCCIVCLEGSRESLVKPCITECTIIINNKKKNWCN